MANCPKCNYKLRLVDWRQTCPKCGANMVLYDLQERLMKDADKAEVQHYHFQKKVDRLKASFVGSKLAIVRIFTSLFPILAVLLPIINIKVSPPMLAFSGKIGALEFFDGISDKLDFGILIGLVKQPDTATGAVCLLIFLISIAVSLVCVLIHFLCLMMACSPHGKIRSRILNGIILATAVISVASLLCIPENNVISGTPAIGAYLYVVLAVACAVLDILVYKKGIEITHQQCYVGGIPIEEYFEMVEQGVTQEELRAEMYRRLNELQDKKDAELAELERKKEEEEKKKEAVSK